MNLASILLVAGPLMGITLNGLAGSASPKSSKPPIKVMTSNTGGSASHLLGLLWEIRRIAPDIILMQEVNRDSALVIDEQLADWKTLSLNGYLVAAKGDITHIADCITTPFQRKTAVACEVSTSEGPLMVINLHLTTARWGLQKLGMLSFLTNEGVQEFQEAERKRLEEALETREWVNQVTAGRRYIIGGDFNSPEEYDAYERAWGDLTNSFSFRGTGYGYTALCNKRAYWPDNFPWVRIDHLLHANEVRCHSVNVGRTGSSDHRTLTAEFTLGGSE